MNTTQQRPSLEALEQELERQNAELETALAVLESLGDVQVAVPADVYEWVTESNDERATTGATTNNLPIFGIRI